MATAWSLVKGLFMILYVNAYSGLELPKPCATDRNQLCCDGVLHARDNRLDLRCCGNKTYDVRGHICCEDNESRASLIHDVSIPSLHGCCGLGIYTKASEYCDEDTGTAKKISVPLKRPRRSLSCSEGSCTDGKYVAPGKSNSSSTRGIFGCACCGDRPYDVLNEECCSVEAAVVARRGQMCCNGKAVRGAEGLVCCGDRAINLRRRRCCHEYGSNGHLVKSTAYRLAREQCCGGKVMKSSIPCCNQKWPMDEKLQVCCPHHGPRNKTRHSQDLCCEDQWMDFAEPYVSETQVCLNNEVKERKDLCQNGMALCGSTCYHPDTDICCPGGHSPEGIHRIYSKLTDGDKCCGGRAYFSWSQSCCDGQLYNTSLLQCCCKGKIPYDPFTQKCVERRKRKASCKVVGCPVEIASKGQLRKIKKHLLTKEWLVVKTKSVVRAKQDDDFVQVSGVTLFPKPKRKVKIKALKSCNPKIGKKNAVLLVSFERGQSSKALLLAKEDDYIFKKKSIYQQVKKCLVLLLKSKSVEKNSKCKKLMKENVDR